MQIRKAEKKDMQAIQALYRLAFPRQERKPFSMLLRAQKRGVEILVIEEEGFAGMVVNLIDRDIVLIDYLAICPDKRGRGIGSQVLQAIRDYYPNCRIILEIEAIDPRAKNAQQRMQRKNFYLRNGFCENNMHVWIYRMDMEILYWGGSVTMEEYKQVIRKNFGQWTLTLLRPKKLSQPKL